MHRTIIRALFAVFALSLATAHADTLIKAPLPIEVAAGIRELAGEPVPSPDGKLVAYVVHNGAKARPFPILTPTWNYSTTGVINVKMARELWIVELDSGRSYALHPKAGSSFSPAWSPDGKQLAFYSDEDGSLGLWVWSRGGDARRVTPAIAKPWQNDGAPVWMDGQRLFAAFLPEGFDLGNLIDLVDPEGRSVGAKDEVTLRRQDDSRWLREHFADLGFVDLRTGKVTRVVERKAIWNWSLSPNGAFVAVADWVGSGLFDNFIVAIADKSTKFTMRGLGAQQKTVWASDSARVYLDAANAAPDFVGDLRPNQQTLVIDTNTWQQARGALPGKSSERFDAPKGKRNTFAVRVPGTNDLLVDLTEDYRFGDLWLARKGKPVKRLTHLNPEYDRYDVGKVIRVDWKDKQGRELYGALLLPPDYQNGKQYPVHVDVYGQSSLDLEFHAPGIQGYASPIWNYHVLSTRGYAVFKPIAPYGYNTALRDISEAVISGVDHLIALGIANPDRLTVEGQSFGGYCVRSIVTQTDRFKAAISTAGSNGTVIPSYPWGAGQARISADLYKNQEVFIANSPMFFYDRVKTPLLFQVGLSDGRDTETDWEVRVLRKLGVETEFLRYEGEGHVIFGYSNVLDFWKRRIDWIEKHST